LLLHNLENQQQAYDNFYNLLKPTGRLLVVTVNPYYGYPVGVWKRGLVGRLFNKNRSLNCGLTLNFTDVARGGFGRAKTSLKIFPFAGAIKLRPGRGI